MDCQDSPPFNLPLHPYWYLCYFPKKTAKKILSPREKEEIKLKKNNYLMQLALEGFILPFSQNKFLTNKESNTSFSVELKGIRMRK